MPDFLEQLESNFDTRTVDIATFAESPEFLGKPLYPRQRLLLKLLFLEDLTPYEDKILDYWIAGGRGGDEIVISPDIRGRIKRLKASGAKHFREVVIVAGRRASKGHTTGIALAKILYDANLHDDPREYFGVDKNKEIYFSCIATAQDQAKKLQYADFSSAVNSCKPLQKYIQKVQELEFSVNSKADLRQREIWRAQGRKVMRDTATLRGNALPANSSTLRGQTTLAADLDEFSFFLPGDSFQSDNECYEALKPSMDQFGPEAMLVVKSSPASKVGKFYERFQAAMAVDKDGVPLYDNIFTIQIPSWSLYEGYNDEEAEYKGPDQVQAASPDWDPEQRNSDGSYFYNEINRALILEARQEEMQNPEKFKVERRGKWSETIDAYLLPEKVDEMFMGRPLPDGSGYEPMKTNRMESSYNFQYVAHLDPSSTTAGFGFALGHLEYLEINGVTTPNALLDIIKIWRPQEFPGGVLIWEDVIQEVIFYCQQFRPYELSSDQFSSGPLLQTLRTELRKRGLTDVRVYEKVASASTNWKRYETFKTALYRGLVHAPNDNRDTEQAANELKFLQVINTGQIPRVDKQSTGEIKTKDASDSLAAVVETLIGGLDLNNARNEMMMQPVRVGAQGGYQMMLQDGQHPLGKLSLTESRRHFEVQELARASKGGGRSRQSPIRTWGARQGSRRMGR